VFVGWETGSSVKNILEGRGGEGTRTYCERSDKNRKGTVLERKSLRGGERVVNLRWLVVRCGKWDVGWRLIGPSFVGAIKRIKL